jgi:DNA-binding PadR family transcriptional regulator
MQLLVIEAVGALAADAYGLAIMDFVNERLGRERAVDPGSIYVTLKRLAQRQFVVVKRTRTVRSSPPLKVYAVTPAGRRAHSIAMAEARAMHHALTQSKRRSSMQTDT